MKKKKTIAIVLSLLISALVLTFSVVTVFAYSTDEDPLITLSYLNEVVIPKLKSELAGASVSKPVENVPNATQDSDGTYELLELKLGQTVKVSSATELIVRPGSIVTVVSPFAEQGIADITNGNELLNGNEIPVNAYCIIPRGDDGRGFYVNSEKAYILIRGEYNIG